MSRKIFVLDGHPVKGSLVTSLCVSYADGAQETGHDVRTMGISDMKFEMDLDHGYGEEKTLEPDLLAFQENLKWCDHFVLGYPLWWGSVPAKTKGLIDRALLPGFAFTYDKDTNKVGQLLKDKSAHVMVTSDTPNWYLNLVYGAAGFRMMRKQVLEFCGIKPVTNAHFSTVMDADESQRNIWLKKAKSNGSNVK